MINTDRVVPIQAVDLISMYGLILQQVNTTLAKVTSDTVDGIFTITEATTPLIADEPVQSVNFASGVTAATLFFVPAYSYTGFMINNAEVTPTGTVNADGKTLYKAVLADGAVTITQVGF